MTELQTLKEECSKKRKNCRRIKWKAVSKDNITRLEYITSK